MTHQAARHVHRTLLRGSDERGDIVAGWLAKVVICMFLTGIVFFDGISIFSTQLAVEDDADTAARAASDAWSNQKSVPAALVQAKQSAEDSSPANELDEKSFRVTSDGAVTLTLRRTAKTLIVQRISAIESWGKIQRSGQGKSLS